MDMIGKKYGNLTVINYIGNNKKNLKLYKCLCDCGNIIDVVGCYLRSGKKDNCGCKTKEKQSLSKRKYNTYDLTGEYGIGYTLKGKEFYFDLEDYDKIKDYCWNVHEGYITAMNKERKYVRIHRIIMDIEDQNIQVDHSNRNPIDNRKENLRVCTDLENSRNKNIRKNNLTGFIGISIRENGTYRVRIRDGKKEISIGCYKNIEDAIYNRLKAELKYYGNEFAPQRHLFEKYGIEEN